MISAGQAPKGMPERAAADRRRAYSSSMTQTLERATPESLGIPSGAITAWIDELERIAPDYHSLMIVRHGRVAAEGWWAPNASNLDHALFSVSKSFTSTAVGLAIAAGHLGLDDAVVSFFPAEAPARISPNLAAMKVRHLLTMSTGQDQATIDGADFGDGRDLVRRFLAYPVADAPGTRFIYNTPATYMLSAIVQKCTGMNLVDYLQPRLFEPLGIERPTWEADADGVSMGGFGLRLRTEDVARFGQLYLQRGVWGGRQLVPAEWIEQATSLQIDTTPTLNPSPDWLQGYGFQFWRGRHGSFRGDGAFGQYCIVVPEADLVVAMTAGVGPMNLGIESLWSLVLARLQPGPLPEDATSQQVLAARLADLRLVPHQGETSSPWEADLAGAEFAFAANEFGFDSIRLAFDAGGGTLFMGARNGPPGRLEFGRGEWRIGDCSALARWPGQSMAASSFWLSKPLAASATWPRPGCLELDVCLYSNAYRFTLTFDFSRPQLRLAVRVNVSFGATDLGMLVAGERRVGVAPDGSRPGPLEK
jgi:CubicO group peptidase (beta-lactamase class C family)